MFKGQCHKYMWMDIYAETYLICFTVHSVLHAVRSRVPFGHVELCAQINKENTGTHARRSTVSVNPESCPR